MKRGACLAGWAAAFAASAWAADFGSPGGPPPANVEAIAGILRKDPYDLELLISFGTSKGGSAGHLALSVRGEPNEELVYSANFYADRKAEHEKDFYIDDLMVRIPKMEYLYATTSSLSDKAAFGLDFGEVYKRSVVGIRVYGVPASEKEALRAYFARINDDFHARASGTEYHDREVKYDYLRLNCAKTIGSAFRYGAGYHDLKIEGVSRLLRRPVLTALNANVPTEMALKLLEQWNARGYGLDVVLYQKYRGSSHVDPHDDEPVAFKDLPNRFPSVLSRDFRREQGNYQDYDNLFAMYLLHNLAKYVVRVNDATKALEIATRKVPTPYAVALKRAAASAQADEERYGRGLRFKPRGTPIGDAPGGTPPPGSSGGGR